MRLLSAMATVILACSMVVGNAARASMDAGNDPGSRGVPTRDMLIAATMARNGPALAQLDIGRDAIEASVDRLLADEVALEQQAVEVSQSRASFAMRLSLAESYDYLGFPAAAHRHLSAIESTARALGAAGVSRLSRVALVRALRLRDRRTLPVDPTMLTNDIAAACAVGESMVEDVDRIAFGLDTLAVAYLSAGDDAAALVLLDAAMICFGATGRNASEQLPSLPELARIRLDRSLPAAAYAEMLDGLRRRAEFADQSATYGFLSEVGAADQDLGLALYAGLFLDALRRDRGGNDSSPAPLSYRPETLRDPFGVAQRLFDTPAGAALRRRAARDAATYNRNDGAVALIDEQAVLIHDFRLRRLERAQMFAGAGLDPTLARLDGGTPDRVVAITQSLEQQGIYLTNRLVEAREVSAVLRDNEAMLLVAPTPRGTHLFVVRRGADPLWHRSALSDTQVGALAREIRFHMTVDVNASPDEFGRWSEQGFALTAAHRLYVELVAPFASALAGIDHLIVVAGGPLDGLPFGLLVTEPSAGNSFVPATLRETRWLADHFAMSRLSTAQAFVLLRNAARNRQMIEQSQPSGRRSGRADGSRPTSYVAFADPVLAGPLVECGIEAQRGGALTRSMPADFSPGGSLQDALRMLPRLPCTNDEAMQVAIATDASRRRIFAGPGNVESRIHAGRDVAQASILMFATHALMPGEVPGVIEPSLVMTPPATVAATAASVSPTFIDDGLLAGSEIADLRFAPDWLILSACNTAEGGAAFGTRNVGGLTPYFFVAGATRILATNWPLLDSAAADITGRAIRNAARGRIGGAEALRRAMIAVRNDPSRDNMAGASLAHPMIWAAFELHGDGGSTGQIR